MSATTVTCVEIRCDGAGCTAELEWQQDDGVGHWPSRRAAATSVAEYIHGWEVSSTGDAQDLCPDCVCGRDGHQWGEPITERRLVICERCSSFQPREERHPALAVPEIADPEIVEQAVPVGSLPPLVVMDCYDAIECVRTRPDAPSRVLAETAQTVADLWNDPPGGGPQRDLVRGAYPELGTALDDLLGGGPTL